MLRRRAATLVLAAMVASGCASDRSSRVEPAPTTTATTQATATASTPGEFVPQPIAWHDCGTRLQCGTLDVPIDYADPTGPTITLALNQRRALNPDERIGALLFNPGGPGASGRGFVTSGLAVSRDVQDRFDLIGFDPRGVGESTPLPCGDATVPMFRHQDSTPDTADEQAALDAAAKAVADDCAARAGNLLAHIGTDDIVRDMDTIRRALGDTTINYLGVSYGTMLGLRFAQLFPSSVRAFVLDAVVDPTQDLRGALRQQAIAFDRVVNGILDAAGATAKYDELATRIETDPVPAGDGRTLGPAELPTAAMMPAYSPSYSSRFFRGIDEALNGDASTLMQVYDSYSPTSFINYVAVTCVDLPHPVGSTDYQAFAQELTRLSPRFGGSLANELLPCAYWPTAVQSVVGPIAAPNAPPILVIGTTGDSATPYDSAVAVASTLQQGRLLTFDAAQHSAYGKSTCVQQVEAAYFLDLALPPEGTTCNR